MRKHLTFSNVTACLALFIALGGGAYAVTRAPHNSVYSGSIKNRQVKNQDLATHAVSAAKLRTSAVTTSKIANGAVTDNKLGSIYQFGNGQTFALSGELQTTDPDPTIGPADIVDGDITFKCAATPSLIFNDADDGGAFNTELWDNGGHQPVTDHTQATINIPSNQTHTVQIFGLGTTTIVASAFVNGTTCDLAASVDTNF